MPRPRANRADRTSRRLPDAQSLHLARRTTARSFPGVPLALRFSSRSFCASFLAAAQSDPRRGASCYCGYLSPAALASLSPGSGQTSNLFLHLQQHQDLLAEQGFLLLHAFITLCHLLPQALISFFNGHAFTLLGFTTFGKSPADRV